MKYSILNAILWAAAILASALLHGPLDLSLILTCLSLGSIIASEKQGAKASCRQ